MSGSVFDKFSNTSAAEDLHQGPPCDQANGFPPDSGDDRVAMNNLAGGHYMSALSGQQADFDKTNDLYPVGTEEFLSDQDFMNMTTNTSNASAPWEASMREYLLGPRDLNGISSTEENESIHDDVAAPGRQDHALGPQNLQQSSQLAKKAAEEKAKKIERARNAANHRHHKVIKVRKDSRQPGGVAEAGEEDAEERKEEYRAKNRDAAARCRSKKKESTDKLEAEHRKLASEQIQLSTELRSLRNQVTHYRTLLLEHNQHEEGCGCTIIHQFNRQRAHDLVQDHSHSQPNSSLASMFMSPGLEGATGSPQSTGHSASNQMGVAGESAKGQEYMPSPELCWTPVTTPESFDFSSRSATATVGEGNQYQFMEFMENFQGEDHFQHE